MNYTLWYILVRMVVVVGCYLLKLSLFVGT